MSNFPYLVPTLKDAPKRLFDWESAHNLRSEGAPELRLGLYCSDSSHADNPWFLGSFTPSYEVLKQTGELLWVFTGDWATGDGHLIAVKGAAMQVISGGKRMESDDHGIMTTAPEGVGVNSHARYQFKCGLCGLKRNFRSETFQEAVSTFLRAGGREVSLSMLISAIDRLRK